MRCFGLLLTGILLLAGCNLTNTPPEPTPEATPLIAERTCAELVNTAITTVATACTGIGRNQACYGNRDISAEFLEADTPSFRQAGDLANLLTLHRLTTSALDETAQTWGLALLRVQANLPDTLPGQNVTFLLYGDANLDGISPQANALRLETSFGPPQCPEAPPAALLLQAPGGTSVTMTMNGATLTLGSTLHLRAYQGDKLMVAVIEGTGIVSAFDTTRVIQPGAQVTLPLGGADGLAVVGPPSVLEAFDLAAIQAAPLLLLETPVNIPAPISQPGTATLTPTLARAATVAAPAVACAPRSDWTATYAIQRGDTLFSIAQRFNISVAELQQANCLVNPNLIQPRQVLRVPFVLPLPGITLTPTALPSFTPVPTATSKPTITLPPLPFDTPVRPNPNEPAATANPLR